MNTPSEERLYTTGQFAELCGVKKQTLFHYDDIDLLKPARVDDNGYRRYSHDQYETFLLISCLKEADMTLSEIKDYLTETDEEKKAQTMQVRIASLDRRIGYLMHVRQILASSFSSNGGIIGSKLGNNDEIKLVNRPALMMWATPRLDLMDDKELVEKVAQVVKHVEPFGVCLSSADVQAGLLDNQKHLLVLPSQALDAQRAEELGLVPFTRPEGRYGVTKQQSGETPEDVYARLLKSMEDFAETPGEFFYEEYPSASGASPDEGITIAVQLIPIDPDDGIFH